MRVLNIHQRELAATAEQVGALIDGLGGPGDRLWPRQVWPPMRFDRPLGVGAAGGHGPIRYTVDEYQPGSTVVFRFTGPRGFVGQHGYEAVPGQDGRIVLRQVLRMDTRGAARFTWPLVFRPLHDALIEDSLAGAQAQLGLPPAVRPWSPWVRILRRILGGGKARSQRVPPAGSRRNPPAAPRPASSDPSAARPR